MTVALRLTMAPPLPPCPLDRTRFWKIAVRPVLTSNNVYGSAEPSPRTVTLLSVGPVTVVLEVNCGNAVVSWITFCPVPEMLKVMMSATAAVLLAEVIASRSVVTPSEAIVSPVEVTVIVAARAEVTARVLARAAQERINTVKQWEIRWFMVFFVIICRGFRPLVSSAWKTRASKLRRGAR